MDQDILVTAITGQLNGLSSLISTTVGLALVAAWTGLQGEERVSLFSLSVERRHAFYILGASFITANITAIIYFLRLADIVAQIDDAHLAEALTTLGTNAWPYNPFAVFGDSAFSALHSSFGYGLLIIIWWIGFTALSLLIEYPTRKIAEWFVMSGFFFVGIASMATIQLVFFEVADRVIDKGTPIDLQASGVRATFAFVGIALGGGLFFLAQRFRARRIGPHNLIDRVLDPVRDNDL
jgi:hypothetical protein